MHGRQNSVYESMPYVTYFEQPACNQCDKWHRLQILIFTADS